MKKKSPRGIPDFSNRTTRAKDGSAAADSAAPGKTNARKASPPPRVKPQSTSAKSGQRGQ